MYEVNTQSLSDEWVDEMQKLDNDIFLQEDTVYSYFDSMSDIDTKFTKVREDFDIFSEDDMEYWASYPDGEELFLNE